MILLLYNTSKFIVGASLSEPHIDEMNVRNLYIIIIIIIIIIMIIIIIYYYYGTYVTRAPL